MWFIFRALSSAISISLIVLTIPIAFDVGGRDSGLAFSLSLAIFYFLLSSLRLITPNESRFRSAALWIFAKSAWVTVPALLIWSLAKFSVDAPSTPWIERTFNYKRAGDLSIYEWIFGRGGLLESSLIGGWGKFLRWSTPVFQIGEGFCSLLVIQACGQLTRWVINGDHGDSWMVCYNNSRKVLFTDFLKIGLMGLSAGIISSSIYFLFRIFSFPEIGNVDAILIGFALACAIILGSWGIISGRGNAVESSLLVG